MSAAPPATYHVLPVVRVHLLLANHLFDRRVLHHFCLLLSPNHQSVFLRLHLQVIGLIQLFELLLLILFH